ncbi:MAG: T9SS type A sorting domain-containing protein [Bacteroidota bacterium]
MKKNLLFLRLIFFGLIMLFGSGWVVGQTTVFSDDFSTNTSSNWTTTGQISSSSWYVNRSGTDWGARRNSSPLQLELTNDVGATANVNGWVFANVSTSTFSVPYSSTLRDNPDIVTWYFNIRQSRTDPAGFTSGSYGAAFILATTNQNVNNSGNGYAIVYGQSGSTDPIRLAKFNNGLSGTITNIITSNTIGLTDFGAEYISCKVTFDPSNNQWELFLRNDGTSSFADPTGGSLTTQGTIIDNIYTSIPLDYMGGYWQGSTSAAQTAFFDNVIVKVNAIPSISTGNWTDGSTWVGGVVPLTSENVVIPSGHTVTIGSSITRNAGTTTTVNTGGILATGAVLTNNGTTTINGTFQINEGGWATGTDFVYGAAGTLVFNNSSGFYGFNGGVFWPTSNGPVNVTVQNTGGLELQTSRTVTGVFQTAKGVRNNAPGNDLTVSGSVIINSGGYFDNFSPIYSGSGTLIYNTGGSYGVYNEWITGSSIGYGVPQNVTIQTSGTNVSLNANKSILGTLTISNGSILTSGTHVISGDGAVTVNDGGTLKVGSTSVSGAIAGNLTNTGGLTLSSGSTVEFNGSAAQTIASRTFSNLTINNASGVTMGSDASVTVGNTFTNSAGSSFVVESDASNSGSLIMANYTGSGTFTYKRYMPDAVWHMLGSPLSGQTINSGFVSGNSLTGMKHYIEGDDNWSTDYASTPPDAAFTLAKGYATKRSASGTVDLTGTPNTAAISDIALTRTNFGWNLLSNPFTSAIAANTQGDATNNLISINSSGVLDPNYTALYIWDGTAYKIINHASGSPTASLVQDYLQVGQGFFVKSKLGGGTFSITPAMQSHQTGIAFKSNPIQLASIVLNAEKNTSKISTQISYKENMNRGLDIGYDAGLMKGNPSFALYSRLVEDNGVDFGIQCLPAEYDDLVVPIGLDAKSGDIIKFTAQSFNLPEEYNVFLEDRVLGIYTNLSINDASYSVQLNSDAKGTGRFFVRTSMESALGIANLDNGNPFKVFTRPNHNQIVIHGEANTNTIVRIYSISGKQITSFSLKQSTENLVQFNEEAGVYIVKISNEQGTYTQKFGWLK